MKSDFFHTLFRPRAWAPMLMVLPLVAGAVSPTARIPLAVVGDSDSHGYQDTRAFPPGSPDRGGAQRAHTYQWTEVLAALRGNRLDLGPREETGTYGRLARAAHAVGWSARAPRKLDHRYNFAVSGQGCDDLWGGPSRQVPELLNLMADDPARWRGGVVVFRIGINTFGKSDQLDRLARDPKDPQVAGLIDTCVQQLRTSVEAIAKGHPQTRMVLVGTFDNRHWPPYLERWRTPSAQANISAGLDRFDTALRGIAASRPQVAFFDDRAWFAGRWGGRDAQGQPAYRTVPFGPRTVTNTQGDDPSNAVVADGHAGTVWNALWAQALVELLNRRFGYGITPLDDAEMVSLLTRPAVR